jgi:hypothetical protein
MNGLLISLALIFVSSTLLTGCSTGHTYAERDAQVELLSTTQQHCIKGTLMECQCMPPHDGSFTCSDCREVRSCNVARFYDVEIGIGR